MNLRKIDCADITEDIGTCDCFGILDYCFANNLTDNISKIITTIWTDYPSAFARRIIADYVSTEDYVNHNPLAHAIEFDEEYIEPLMTQLTFSNDDVIYALETWLYAFKKMDYTYVCIGLCRV